MLQRALERRGRRSILAHILQCFADFFVQSLEDSFSFSLVIGMWPNDWRTEDIYPLFREMGLGNANPDETKWLYWFREAVNNAINNQVSWCVLRFFWPACLSISPMTSNPLGLYEIWKWLMKFDLPINPAKSDIIAIGRAPLTPLSFGTMPPDDSIQMTNTSNDLEWGVSIKVPSHFSPLAERLLPKTSSFYG